MRCFKGFRAIQPTFSLSLIQDKPSPAILLSHWAGQMSYTHISLAFPRLQGSFWSRCRMSFQAESKDERWRLASGCAVLSCEPWSGRPTGGRADRNSGFARARKQFQAVIVSDVSLEAPPPARQDDIDTTSIIVNGRKGLYGHGHRDGPAVPVSNARSAPQHGASDSYSAARFIRPARSIFSNALNFCRSAIAA